MKRTNWLALTAASVLAAGCPGDDIPSLTSGSSTGGEESTGEPMATGDTIDPSATSSPSVDSSSGEPDPDSSSGEPPGTTGPAFECGNDVIDGDDVCDGSDLAGEDCVTQGYDAGTLACAKDCTGFDASDCVSFSCGNDIVEGKEVCDGTDFGGVTCQDQGFDSGSLSCALNCGSFETDTCGTCGNVIVDGDEVCDGIVLLGQTCVSQGFDSGTLGCASDCLSYESAGCGTCGNDIIDGAEICDNLNNGGQTCLTLGFDSGTLGSCQADCMDFDTSACGTCGNGVVDGDEFCDAGALGGETCVTQGFDNGTLACDLASSCGAFDTSGCGVCGNGIIDGSESCDGANLDGETCASLGLIGGTLSCSASCQYDFASCDIPGMPFGNDTGYSGYAINAGVTTCDDISATGIGTLLTDDSNLVVPMGFSFPFYGVGYTDANIQSNGTLRFGDATYLSFTNSCLPTATNPSANTLYVFWDDLNPGAAGEVYYQTLGPVGDQRFVVQWDVPHFGGDIVDLMRFQAVLHQTSGQIDVCYVDTLSAANVGNNGAEATTGIQQNSMNGFDYSCNTPTVTNGLQLLYIPL